MENEVIVKEKEPSKNVLGILSVVFAGVSLLGCWVPLLNVLSMILGIAAIVMGIISFILVLCKKANLIVLPIIGVILSIISIWMSNGINNSVSDALNGQGKTSSVSSNSSNSETSKKTDESKDTVATKEVYEVGETVAMDDKELTVTKVDKSYSPKYGNPQSGQKFIKVTVKLENKSSSEIHVNPLDFHILDSSGAKEDVDSNTYSLSDQFKYADLTPGGTREGSVVFEVPKDDSNLTLVYEPSWFSNHQIKIKL